tara:strand:+ start:27694 stop:28353 length:660 start_codon:yes stop_codon:yes gene_type:complete
MQQLLNLCKKARSLRGYKLSQLANLHQVGRPVGNNTSKGWSGQLIEQVLGVKNNSLALPDFPDLGVELKTIPVSLDYKPYETTYVTTVPLLPQYMTSFEDSVLWLKLRCVLWVPLIAKTKSISVQERIIGEPFIWQPSNQEKEIIKQDFDEIMEFIVTGRIDNLSASVGQYLHVRPKALDSYKKTYTVDYESNKIITSPKGFYLRTVLTKQILKRSLEI